MKSLNSVIISNYLLRLACCSHEMLAALGASSLDYYHYINAIRFVVAAVAAVVAAVVLTSPPSHQCTARGLQVTST